MRSMVEAAAWARSAACYPQCPAPALPCGIAFAVAL